MLTEGGFEFVNREKEIQFLSQCLIESSPLQPLIFLRGPSGVGKSTLTDRFRHVQQSPERPFCTVEPEISDSPAALEIYQGCFLQRCAAAIDKIAGKDGYPWPRFSVFLKERRWKTVREKSTHELIEEIPSPKSLYKNALDYASRFLSLGRFDPIFLLKSDQRHAVSLCSLYLKYVLDYFSSVLIVRDTQLCDNYSLRTLLGWQFAGTPVGLIFEYTSVNGFLPLHEKTILRVAELRGSFSILDVRKLSLAHLEQLLRSVSSEISLETEAYLAWNGNLRSVLEFKFRIGIGKKTALSADVPGLLTNLERNLSEHIDGLARDQKMILAFIYANREALAQSVLQRQVMKIDPLLQGSRLSGLLEGLIGTHGFVRNSSDALCLHNETVTQVISDNQSMISLIALAERSLRDHYRNIISTRDFTTIGLSTAVRQIFRLSISTKDVTSLVMSCSELIDQVRLSQDQSIYVEAVCASVTSDPSLYSNDHEYLMLWAATLAYDTSSWERAACIAELSGSSKPFALALRAFALQEIGRHDEALKLSEIIMKSATSVDEEIVAHLIEILVRGCRGESVFARDALLSIINEIRYKDSVLLGYAFRFFDIVEGLVASLPRLESSIDCFDKAGLAKARAYSELPAAMLLARTGRSTEARKLIANASRVLENEVRDQHIILNNTASVELLSENPDANICAEYLEEALRHAKDDFSELTIITNLAQARWLNGELDEAVLCATRMIEILKSHRFADRNIYWPVCFNAAQIFKAAARPDDHDAVLRILDENMTISPIQNFWDYRFGRISEPSQEFAFLATKSVYPIYISHWTVETEGLAVLRK